MAVNWVRVGRYGKPTLSKTASPSEVNINIAFEVAPKPPEMWFSLFHERVGPGRDIPGQIDTSQPVGNAYRGYISSTKEGVGEALAKLDEIIEDTNDRFEAFQRAADEEEAANRARAAADRAQRIKEQNELDAIAEQYAKPPYQAE